MQAPLSFVLPTARSSGRSTALFDPRRPRGRDPPLCSPPSPAVCTASCSVRQARAHCDASLVASYLLVLIALPPISQRSARTSFHPRGPPVCTLTGCAAASAPPPSSAPPTLVRRPFIPSARPPQEGDAVGFSEPIYSDLLWEALRQICTQACHASSPYLCLRALPGSGDVLCC
ncbi:unnamed protein product [Prorocentrum cordatum]|uniref:Uncharacterized protein n=1 Tax=Prorocentrum cordatum TaxID=2364126 RepID=A0ABN9SMB2_9DINO|nr:unnamed protein product [Polarella glacialis]